VGSSAYLWQYDANSVRGAQVRHPALLTLSALTGLYVDEYAGDREARTPAFGLGPAGTRFYSLTGDGVVRVWDYATGRELASSEPDFMPLMALSPDGRLAAIPDASGGIEIRSLADGALVRHLPGEWFPSAIAFNSLSLLTVLQANGQLALIGLETGEVVEQFSGDVYADGRFFAASPDGRWMALWGRAAGRTALNVLSLGPGRVAFSLGPYPRADQARFSPDGRRLAVVRDRAVEVWDLATRQVVATLQASGRAVGALAFHPAGTRLYAATGEIWDLASGAQVAAFESGASIVAVSPNGQVLVGDDGTVWNAEDGLLTGALAGVRSRAISLAFTPDGERLVWQAGDGVIEVWQMRP
jgi:WD40 repeat protein